MNIFALLVTLIAGLFFLVGLVITRVAKNKDKLFNFSISLAFVIMLGLIIFDLVPELFENIETYANGIKVLIFVGSIAVGFGLLKGLDLIVPHHHHDHFEGETNTEEHNSNLYHIGLVTCIALVLHNIIEGSAIYINSLISIKIGVLMALGVGLHNIPLGMEICTTLNLSEKKWYQNVPPVLAIVLSTTLGGVTAYYLNINSNPLVMASLIGVTIGMAAYLVVFELFKEVKRNFGDIPSMLGILCGTIIVVISWFI